MMGNLGMLLDRKVPLVVKSLEKVPFEHTFHGTVSSWNDFCGRIFC